MAVESIRNMTGVSGTAGVVKRNPNLVSGLGEQPPHTTGSSIAPIVKRNPASNHTNLQHLNVPLQTPRHVFTSKQTAHISSVKGKRQ